MPNRLSGASSPYLLQHAENPVDWWPWCDEAFAEARRRDVPVLLSVGYAACHWCHVMAHESFENDAVADQLNAGFVCVKVDREERPDVDAVYMSATQLMTGQGGWPMTCLLDAHGAPFYCGTYFPPAQFRQLLAAASDAWNERRGDLNETSARVVDAVAEQGQRPGGQLPDAAALDAAAGVLAGEFDQRNGGFTGAPKFPPAMVLEFLLRHWERTGSPETLGVVERTGGAMARGGMYDQLGGGFARYSVDAAWVVPHFEKMLYDNALLLRFYLHWWRRTDSALARRVAGQTADFLLRDLATQEGGFASALDADTDGVEGLTYAWTPAQLGDVLGESEGRYAAALLTVTDAGTFEHGSSTLQLRVDPEDPARWAAARARLFAARGERPQPGRDDKVVTAWNGLALGALAEAGVLLDEPRYLTAAVRCAELVLRVHRRADGRLVRTSRDGTAGSSAGVAEDYGCLADGLLVLHQATADPRWLTAAGELLDLARRHFTDAEGHFYDTADDAEALIHRPWDPTDNVTPSGQSSLAAALLTYSVLAGSAEHRTAAEDALAVAGALAGRFPRHLGWALAAAEAALAGPVQVAVVGERGVDRGRDDGGAASGPASGPAQPGTGPLAAAAWRHRGPGGVVVAGEPDAPGVPVLAERPTVRRADAAGGQNDHAAAYICRGMVCDLPVTEVEDLIAGLG